MKTKQRKQIAILGGGITGVCLAKALSGQKNCEVHLFEKRYELGGLLKSIEINGNKIDIGPYFFPMDWKFFKWFPSTREYFEIHKPIVKTITPKYSLDDYPMSFRVFLRDNGTLSLLPSVASLLWAKLKRNYNRNTAAFAEFWLGNIIFKTSGLHHYIERMFQISPNELSSEFAKLRMRGLEQLSLMRFIKRLFIHIFSKPLYYTPIIHKKEYGFGEIFEVIRKELIESGVTVHLNTGIQTIEKVNSNKWFMSVQNKGLPIFDEIYSTIPIPEIKLEGKADFTKTTIPILSLVTLFVSINSKKQFSVLYNHTFSGRWKRLTNFSWLYPDNRDYDIYAIEITISQNEKLNINELFSDFKNIIKEMGFNVEEFELLDYFITENAYPVIRFDSIDLIQSLRNDLDKTGIYHLGRNGNFEYLNAVGVLDQLDNFIQNRI